MNLNINSMKIKFVNDQFAQSVSNSIHPNFKTIFLFDHFPKIDILEYYTNEILQTQMEIILQKKRIIDTPFGFWSDGIL